MTIAIAKETVFEYLMRVHGSPDNCHLCLSPSYDPVEYEDGWCPDCGDTVWHCVDCHCLSARAGGYLGCKGGFVMF